MKRIVIAALCLALMLPLCPSLAEEGGWLSPFIAAYARRENTVRRTLTLEMDGDAWADMYDEAYDKSYEQTLDYLANFFSSDEEASQLEAYREQIEQAKREMRQNCLALAALVNALSIEGRCTGYTTQFTVRVSGKDEAEFIYWPDQDGCLYLAGDLFPGFAIRVNNQVNIGAAFSTLLGQAGADAAALPAMTQQEYLAFVDRVWAALPAYADYHPLEQAMAVARALFQDWERRGLTAREGDAAVYEIPAGGALPAVADVIEAAQKADPPVTVDARTLRLLKLVQKAPFSMPDVENDGAPLSLRFALTDEALTVTAVKENTPVTLTADPVEGEADPFGADGENAQLQENARQLYEATGKPQVTTLHLSADGLTLEQTGPFSQSSLTVDASRPGAIEGGTVLAFLYDDDPSPISEASFRALRTPEGLDIAYTNRRSLPGKEDLTLRLACSGDLSSMTAEAILEGEAPRTLLAFHIEEAPDGGEPVTAPSAADYTAVPYPQTDNDEATAAFHQAFQAEGLPRLLRILTEDLPEEAKPILSTLLPQLTDGK